MKLDQYGCVRFIPLFLVNDATGNCTYGDVRLVGGSDQYEGRVEVCIEMLYKRSYEGCIHSSSTRLKLYLASQECC